MEPGPAQRCRFGKAGAQGRGAQDVVCASLTVPSASTANLGRECVKQHLADGGKMKLGGLLAGCLLFLEVRPLALSTARAWRGRLCLLVETVSPTATRQDNVVGEGSRSAFLATNQPRVCMTLSLSLCRHNQVLMLIMACKLTWGSGGIGAAGVWVRCRPLSHCPPSLRADVFVQNTH